MVTAETNNVVAEEHPRVGVAVLLFDGDRILLGKRAKSGIGNGCWQCPGGHLEFMEELIDCGKRELLEETGLEGTTWTIVKTTNNIFVRERAHYITIWLAAEVADPCRLQDVEGRCKWAWHSINNLPAPLFEPSGVMNVDVLGEIRSAMVNGL